MDYNYLELKDYTDIDLDELIEYFESTYFKPVLEISKTPLFMGKYSVNLSFHRDWENNRFGIRLDLTDYSKYPLNPD